MAFEGFIQNDGQLIGIIDDEHVTLYDYNLNGKDSKLGIDISESRYGVKHEGERNYRVIFKETGKKEADITLEHYLDKETAEKRRIEIQGLFEKLTAFK